MKQICLSPRFESKEQRERERENQKRSADVQTLSKFSPKCDAQHVVRDPQRSFFSFFWLFPFWASRLPPSSFLPQATKKKDTSKFIYKSIKSRECERREKGRDLGGGYICSSYSSSSEGLSREIQPTLSSLSLLFFFFFSSFFAISSLLNCERDDDEYERPIPNRLWWWSPRSAKRA